ncbi:MAG: hypothetical protein ACLGIB_00625 [Actinomycetota bacterium]
MNAKQLAVVSAIVGLVLAAIVVLLVTGGAPAEQQAKDASGDVVVGEGNTAPALTALADIQEARVFEEASQIVFQATMGAPIPKSLKGQSMEWRWEVSEGGTLTWLVTANVSVDKPVASVTAQQSGYGSSTIDGLLPGRIDYEGNTITVRLTQPEIPDFPGRFTWNLKATLDGDRADPASATATDTAPESGLSEYPPPE